MYKHRQAKTRSPPGLYGAVASAVLMIVVASTTPVGSAPKVGSVTTLMSYGSEAVVTPSSQITARTAGRCYLFTHRRGKPSPFFSNPLITSIGLILIRIYSLTAGGTGGNSEEDKGNIQLFPSKSIKGTSNFSHSPGGNFNDVEVFSS